MSFVEKSWTDEHGVVQQLVRLTPDEMADQALSPHTRLDALVRRVEALEAIAFGSAPGPAAWRDKR